MNYSVTIDCYNTTDFTLGYNLPPFDICFYRHQDATISNVSFVSNPAPQQGTESHENITISFNNT